MPLPLIDPPLINSANPWCSTQADLQALFDDESTGAVTSRTSLLDGFPHDPEIHQFAFFNPLNGDHSIQAKDFHDEPVASSFGGSLNTLGYSPYPLASYLSMVQQITAASKLPESLRRNKPLIISVTGSADDVAKCYRMIQDVQDTVSNPLCMEINLSCPNIPGKPPPAYSGTSLMEYLQKLATHAASSGQRVAIGIKTPPYTYHEQFKILVDALKAASFTIDFITATNTLGSSLILDHDGMPVLESANGAGIGGMAGAPLHPLALGNVRTIRQLLDQQHLDAVDIIGVGGVGDTDGYLRMKRVGATVVGVGTALGREGVPVFAKIIAGLKGMKP